MSTQTVLDNRYELRETLGAGGMGLVVRAFDRLTGEMVALKRVLVAPGQLAFNSRDLTTDLRVALAREFQMLASLRHPNIISVLDYGFDSGGQPYFTMSLLENSRDIRDAARGLDSAGKVALLVQMLHALAYLHRRGILHRDLKPGNVQVANDGQVKVLDFGLAIPVHSLAEAEDTVVGTISYVAPELFEGQLPSVASDLYAVGVVACEMIKGERPYDDTNVGAFINSVMTRPPDLYGVPMPLRPVIERLLARQPAERYPHAEATLEAFCAAAGLPVPVESLAVRESFLQAARFVGREAEFGKLTQALKAVLIPRANPSPSEEGFQSQSLPPRPDADAEGTEVRANGSAWLIGGESGVGKSRLLNELRTRAMVEGVLALYGQSVTDGGLPFQLWQAALRRLALAVPLTDVEASILKAVVPDIGDLLGREIPDAPPMDGRPGQQRLTLTITDVFRRLNQPALLILEDLQWADDDLDMLRALHRLTGDLPLLIVGSYRDDERPSLPDELPFMNVIKLERLPEHSMVELSVSMLGEAGRQPQVVELLRRETEGNAFFLVEVVRALAEEAGRLGDIGRKTLPEKVFAGGVQHIIRRRLGRLPDDARPLLKLAAVAGRGIDEQVLRTFVGAQHVAPLQETTFDNWLTACANAAVLDRQDGRWRFSHDKLREAVLADLTPDEIPILNRQVAEAIEAAHPGDEAYAGALAEHWYAAGDNPKTVFYSTLAARQLNTISRFQAGRRLCERALALLPPDAAERVPLLYLAGETCARLSDFDCSATYFDEALLLARQIGDRFNESVVLRFMGNTAFNKGDYHTAREHILASLDISRQINDARGVGSCQNSLGMMAIVQGSHAEARAYLGESLSAMRELGDLRVVAVILHNLGYLAFAEGDHSAARRWLEESRAVQRSVGDQMLSAGSLQLLGMVTFSQGDHAAAQDYARESLAIQRNIGERRGLSDNLLILGWAAEARGDYAKAQDYYDQALAVSRDSGNPQGVGYALNSQSSLARKKGDYAASQSFADEAITTFENMGDRRGLGYSLNARAHAAFSRGDYETALQYIRRSLEVAAGNDDMILQAASSSLLAFIHLAQKNAAAARQPLQDGLRAARQAGAASLLLELLLGAAWLRVQQGRAADGAELVGLVKAQPLGNNSDLKEWLALMQDDLNAALSPDERARALKRGQSLELAVLVARLVETG